MWSMPPPASAPRYHGACFFLCAPCPAVWCCGLPGAAHAVNCILHLTPDCCACVNTFALRSQPLLEGFARTNPFALLLPDLHQAMKGDQEHLLDLVESSLHPRDRGRVNSAILSLPPFPGLCLPSQGSTTTACHGTQHAALFKVTPVALLAAEASAEALDFAKRLAATMLGEAPALAVTLSPCGSFSGFFGVEWSPSSRLCVEHKQQSLPGMGIS